MNRKLLSSILFVLVSTFFFSSCSDDPVYEDPTVAVTTEAQEIFTYGESRDFQVNISGDYVASEVTLPSGWKAVLDGSILTVTAPAADDRNKENEGMITLMLEGHNDLDATATFEVKAYYLITFEDVAEQYLAGPTAYGENLYNGDYSGYLDPVSNLFFHTTTEGYGFASGGIAISQWNDMTTAGYTNQCSVYFGDNNMKNGGFDHSRTFAVSYCPTFGSSGAYMYFRDDNEEHVIDHAYFTNNTYAVLSMENGDSFAKKFSYEDKDWFKLTITGVSASGETTGEVEVYLADYRSSDAGGILKEWKKVDLTPLGKVNRIDFSMSSSDGSGMWMNTPAYFCMDNVAVTL